MKKLEPYKHYVVRNDVMIEIEETDILDKEPLLYIGSTPSTPAAWEFIFGYKINGELDWDNSEISYEFDYFAEELSKNKLLKISKQISN